jgi:hypothetical protein
MQPVLVIASDDIPFRTKDLIPVAFLYPTPDGTRLDAKLHFCLKRSVACL